MKRLLLLTALIIYPLIIFTQTVTWNGASGIDNDWNTDTNWDSGSVPGVTNDVIIPDGFVVDLDTPGGNVLSLNIQGTSVFNMTTLFSFSNTYTIATGATVNWTNTLSGGGTLTNDGTINVLASNATLGSGALVTTLNNNGDINLTNIGDIFIFTNNVINNNASGVIEIQSNSSGISSLNVAPHVLNNFGMIKSIPPLDTDQVSINVQINNNNGTIQVEKGILNLNANTNPNTFTDGFYTTFPNTTLNLLNNTTISGILGGAINGTLNIPGFLTVPVNATLDFGPTGIISYDATINGGGTLINKSIISISGQPASIQGTTTLINQGIIQFTAAGDFFIQTGSTLNNDAGGTIDFQGDTGNILSQGGSPNEFLNSGLIKTSFTGDGSDTAQISAELYNTGIIEVNNGTLNFFNNNISLDGGTYNIAVNGILDWDAYVTISGSLSGDIQGQLNWNSKVNIIGAASLDFSGSEIINWVIGNIDGGGILTNNNIMNIGSFNVFIYGATTLNNNSIINILNDDDLLIATGGVLNNQLGSTINLLGNGSSVGINSVAPRSFNNYGDIIVNMSNATDNAIITSEFNNFNGNIQVESGTLNLSNSTKDAQNLFDGVYNIFPDGAFDWDSDLTISGELTGVVDGPINWRSDLWVNTATTATFFFTGQKKIFWSPGTLDGGGTLINRSNIDLTNNGNVSINGGTTLNNGGNLTLTTFGDLALNTNGTINNLVDGIIEMQVPAGNIISTGTAGTQTLNNSGTLKSDTGGINSVAINTNNSGLIEIGSGELEFVETRMLHNELTGIIKGNGMLDIPSVANFTNDGTISPGTSPGTLTVIGNYSSTSSAKLEIELDGLIQGSEFDFMPITSTTSSNVTFDGEVEVILSFAPNINDEFIISTVSGTGIISACNLQTPVTASFGGSTYEFSVICRNDNEVVLTATNETLGVDSNEFSENSILLFPNPVLDMFTLKNRSLIDLKNAILYDLQGSLIEEINLEGMGTQKVIPLQRLASGLYFIKINSDNNSITKMLVKR